MFDLLAPEILYTIFDTIDTFDDRWAVIPQLSHRCLEVATMVRADRPPLTPSMVAAAGDRAVDKVIVRHGAEWFRGYELELPPRNFRVFVPTVDLAMFARIVVEQPRLIPTVWRSENIWQWIDIEGKITICRDEVRELFDNYFDPIDGGKVGDIPAGALRAGIFDFIASPNHTFVADLLVRVAKVDKLRDDKVLSVEYVDLLLDYAFVVRQGWTYAAIQSIARQSVPGVMEFPVATLDWHWRDHAEEIRAAIPYIADANEYRAQFFMSLPDVDSTIRDIIAKPHMRPINFQ